MVWHVHYLWPPEEATLCYSEGMTDQLADDAAEVRRLTDVRARLHSRIVEERKAGVPQSDIVRRTGLSREQVRRIERAAGFGGTAAD